MGSMKGKTYVPSQENHAFVTNNGPALGFGLNARVFHTTNAPLTNADRVGISGLRH